MLAEFGDPRLPGRFWSKVRVADSGCWEWVASRQPNGYGSYGLWPKTVSAHRHAYQTLAGDIPPGLDIDHLCRVRHCCNPAHLEPVTRAENARRGIGGAVSAARERSKTHCANGHPFDEANTYIRNYGNAYRSCRACSRISMARRREFLRGQKEQR